MNTVKNRFDTDNNSIDPIVQKEFEFKSLQENNFFQQKMQQQKFDFEKHKFDEEKNHNLKLMGWMVRLYGHGEHASKNIAGTISLLLTLAGIFLTIFSIENIEFIKTFWSVITPIITLSLGYMFGNKNS
jgi:hypothetical protein